MRPVLNIKFPEVFWTKFKLISFHWVIFCYWAAQNGFEDAHEFQQMSIFQLAALFLWWTEGQPLRQKRPSVGIQNTIFVWRESKTLWCYSKYLQYRRKVTEYSDEVLSAQDWGRILKRSHEVLFYDLQVAKVGLLAGNDLLHGLCPQLLHLCILGLGSSGLHVIQHSLTGPTRQKVLLTYHL